MTNPDEAPRLSYTSMDTYERCPLQYRFRYVDRLFAAARPGPLLRQHPPRRSRLVPLR